MRSASEPAIPPDDCELAILQDIFSLLPGGVTVQDEEGGFVLMNAAALAQFGLPETPRERPEGDLSLPAELSERQKTGLELLREGRTSIAEECITHGSEQRTFLTRHRPVRIGDRHLLLSSSTDITAQKSLEAQLVQAAYYDELTGLPGRRLIEHSAASLLRDRADGRKFAIAFLDIDNFKHINDYYGHANGDGLLVELAKRLRLHLRDTDLLSRISGDEFMLLLNPVDSAQEVADYVEFLLQRIKAPFFIGGSEIFASTSIGVSLYPDHGHNYESLHQNADIAMYRAKNGGKGEAVFFTSDMESEALEQMRVEQSLRQAILENRFCCAFQTKVDLRTQEVRGIEALVRLRDDNGVIQAPGSFINLAVELGLIDELTHLVLEEIVRSIDVINETFGSEATISINVAAKQAGNREFMQAFAQTLEATGFASRFMIEVTEDAFLAKASFQEEILPVFRQLGVGISIDDFGIGYSSLSALADITADEIKIDRSFIMDIHKRPRSQGILRAIESLSEALGMTVIAEGVESFEELAYLQAATKIRYAQGYYFSQPIFLEDLIPAVRLSSARITPTNRLHHSARPAPARSGSGRR